MYTLANIVCLCVLYTVQLYSYNYTYVFAVFGLYFVCILYILCIYIGYCYNNNNILLFLLLLLFGRDLSYYPGT